MNSTGNEELTSPLNHLEAILASDSAGLHEAQKQYGNSWKKRGGVGAFMMLARKWDRLESRLCEKPLHDTGDRYDIFAHAMVDCRPEGLIDDIRDLRRYLLLVEAELYRIGAPCVQPPETK